MTGLAFHTSRFSIRGSLSEFSDNSCQNTEKSVSPTDSDVQTFLEREENQNTERKTELYVLSGFRNSVVAAENKNDNWEISHRPILAVYLKDFFVGKDQVNN